MRFGFTKIGFAGCHSADNQDIFVPGVLGDFRAAGHGEPFRLGQDHVLLEYRIDIGSDVCWGSP